MTASATHGKRKAEAESDPRLASVVIPAHNEEGVLSRCLQALTRDLDPGEAEIIVVCNGCTDATADVARSFSEWVTTIEIDEASKPSALNRGDAATTVFPRFYLDADVVMSTEALRRSVRHLESGDVMATSPRLEMDIRQCSWPVRAFYRVWLQLPYCREELLGCGVYALTREGRAKFGDFPDVLADDVYVSLIMSRDQRRVTRDAWFRISPPATLAALIRVRARHNRSGYQLRKRYASLCRTERHEYGSAMRSLVLSPSLWVASLFYGMVSVATHLVGWRQFVSSRNSMTWERDETSRGNAAA